MPSGGRGGPLAQGVERASGPELSCGEQSCTIALSAGIKIRLKNIDFWLTGAQIAVGKLFHAARDFVPALEPHLLVFRFTLDRAFGSPGKDNVAGLERDVAGKYG
jgi:hypothetical protein